MSSTCGTPCSDSETKVDKMAKMIVGCGYLGLRVARLWLQQGERVLVTTRSPLRAKELESQGFEPVVLNVTAAPALTMLPEVDAVLYAVGYDRTAPESMREVYVEGLENMLDSLSPRIGPLVFISSTGVYGQGNDATVNEDSPCNPSREGGKICLEAEQALLGHELGKRSIILRLAGIYGPGRIPRRTDIEAGTTITAPPEGEMNLIHVDDAARLVIELARTASTPELFCVSDGHPVERREYYRYLAQLLNAPEPTFAESPPESAVSQRAVSSKRVDSSKLMARLAQPLQYPSYREGLASIVQAEE